MTVDAARVTSDLLRTIVAATTRITETRREREPLAALEKRAAAARPRGRQFEAALGAHGGANVIAECKRRSPSKGVLAAAYDPVRIATQYERGGAAAVSVLTEPTFFDGALEHLTAVRAAIGLPVLRKDFIVDEYQLFEARAAGDHLLAEIAEGADQILDVHDHGPAAIQRAHQSARRDKFGAAGIDKERGPFHQGKIGFCDDARGIGIQP